jgi:hypothetical protein|tara:strand:- start:1363 stop:1554 length:192 start_codon:yes stop_codon:yes gene_type:complete
MSRQSFQLRLPKDAHTHILDRAWEERISMNQWIVNTIYDKLGLTDSLDKLPIEYIENLSEINE